MTAPASVLLPQLSEVKDRGLVSSAVLSPLSHSTALLTVLQPGITQHEPWLAVETSGPAAADGSADLPDVVSSVLGVVYDIMEEDGDGEETDEILDPVHIRRVQNWLSVTAGKPLGFVCWLSVTSRFYFLPRFLFILLFFIYSRRPNEGSSAARVGSTGSQPLPARQRSAGGLVPPVGPARSQLSPDGVDEVTNGGVSDSYKAVWAQNDPDVVARVLVRLLHAAPEQSDEDEPSVLQQELLADLAEVYQTSQRPDVKRAKKREAASSLPAFHRF